MKPGARKQQRPTSAAAAPSGTEEVQCGFALLVERGQTDVVYTVGEDAQVWVEVARGHVQSLARRIKKPKLFLWGVRAQYNARQRVPSYDAISKQMIRQLERAEPAGPSAPLEDVHTLDGGRSAVVLDIREASSDRTKIGQAVLELLRSCGMLFESPDSGSEPVARAEEIGQTETATIQGLGTFLSTPGDDIPHEGLSGLLARAAAHAVGDRRAISDCLAALGPDAKGELEQAINRLIQAHRDTPQDSWEKKAFAEVISISLRDAGLALNYDGRACYLTATQTAKYPRGRYWIVPLGSKTPVLTSVHLSRLPEAFQLVKPTSPAEAAGEGEESWTDRERKRRKSPPRSPADD